MQISQQHYLKTLGIIRYERRHSVDNHLKKLMVISEKNLNERAEKLLMNMLNTIAFTKKNVRITTISADLMQEMLDIEPHLLIVLDEISHEKMKALVANLQNNIPFIQTFLHPDDVLTHPLEKKNAMKNLLAIQQFFTKTA